MKLFYRKYGEGPPLIILHGLFGSSDNWVHIAHAVENSFTVYLPDLRNHGHSPWSNLHSYPAMARDIIQLSDDLGLDRYFIAGHSMGGKVAMYAALSQPERVMGLLVGDISPFAYQEESEAVNQQMTIISAMMNTNPARYLNRNDLEEYLASLTGEKAARNILAKNIAYEAGKLRWRLNVSAISTNLSKLREGLPRKSDSTPEIQSFPVIFIKGSESDYISQEDIQDIPALFPGAKIKTAEGSGHWIHTERPDIVIEALKDLRS